MRKKENGSVTLEAAIMVPFFIIIMLLVNGLFVLFMGQQIMSHALIQSAKSMAYDPYASQRAGSNIGDNLTNIFVDLFTIGNDNFVSTDDWYEEDNVGDVAKERFLAYIRPEKSSAKGILELVGVKNGANGLDFSGSSVDDGVLTIKLKYTQEFIYNAAGLTDMKRELVVKINLFEYEPM